VLTIPAGSRLTANLGTGNDTLRLDAAAATMTINGGDGTDTLNVLDNTAAIATAGRSVKNIETANLSSASTVKRP